MAYKIDYLVPQRVLTLLAYGTVEAVDFETLHLDSFRLIDEGSAPVHTISLIDPQTKYEKNLTTLIEMLKGPAKLHPDAGWVVQVSEQPVHRFIANLTFQAVYKNARFHTVKSLREALEFLVDRDTTLAGLDIEAALVQYAAWQAVTVS